MTKKAAKDPIVAYRLNDYHYGLLQQKAEERGYRNGNAMARATVLREIDAAHCVSNLIRQNQQDIIGNRDMIKDLAVSLLAVIDADGEQANRVLSELRKYS